MKSIDRLVEITKRLRAPDGCPWDREQTHLSIRGHLVEECAELLEAIDNADNDAMREELGDVLMHIMLHAEIASEQRAFDFNDVVEELADKLVRRHPHVFGDKSAADSAEVLKIWQQVKKDENKARAVGGLFDGIPPQLSAMRLALDIAKKADAETLAKAAQMQAEIEADLKSKAECSRTDAEQKLTDCEKKYAAAQFGRKMFDIILEASKSKVEPEAALRDYINVVRRAADSSSD